MGWVTLTLRKMELKQAHAQYQLRDLQISREKRQMARRKSYNTNSLQTEHQQKLREMKTSQYYSAQNTYNSAMKALRDEYDAYKEGLAEGETTDSFQEWAGQRYEETIQAWENAKLEYSENVNFEKSMNEDELAMIEEEAADEELRLDMEQTEVEAQMEAISQEMQAVSEAISSQIQSSTIKLS